ncbi:retinol dehydrogenase 11-like [Saccoglossus kowalevskii]|uniref:Retinol dehydrogenase 11-like n=1 Tax=Saccoglossus kowalevskii TaxID=10224 RepID=A0ABM0GY26_SACKO|nr:PREDICTED: retinol dehydrogenase 11-like [Saccoglossus kowalevskii]
MVLNVVFMGVVFAVCFAIYYYIAKTSDKCMCPDRLDGKTVIITGGNSGIGKQTALELAKRGARVILACRNKDKGTMAANEITAITDNEDVLCMHCDLASLQSVRMFAQEFCNTEDRLDIIINNAGLLKEHELTEDGYDIVFSSNHLGHFLLTNLLMDKLRENGGGRVINIASDMYMFGKINLENLNHNSDRTQAYSNTKLCNVLFTHHLSKITKGTGVSTFSLHPGMINSDMKRNWYGWLRAIEPMVSILFMKPVEHSIHTPVHCCVAPNLEQYSGSYFKGCTPRWVLPFARDDVVAKGLWEKSERMVGLARRKSYVENVRAVRESSSRQRSFGMM